MDLAGFPGGDLKPRQKVHASGSDAREVGDSEQGFDDKRSNSWLERKFLLSMGWPRQLVDELAVEAHSSGVALIQAAIAAGLLKAPEFYDHLARKLSFAAANDAQPRIVLPSAPSKAWMLLERPLALALGSGEIAGLNAQTLPLDTLATLAAKLGEKRSHIRLLTRQKLIDAVTATYGQTLVSRAVMGLLKFRPDLSAKTGVALWQSFSAAIVAGLFLGALTIAPPETLTLSAFVLSAFFALAIALRFAAAFSLMLPQSRKMAPDGSLLCDADLPRYSVFVPLFREAAILPHLARALSEIDYPPAKLDIKIVLESIDNETIEAALRLSFPGNVDFIIVPDCEPRTKPKALNYALQFATGELAVIYDAEDRPEPDQLRKAATVFHYAPPDLACIQARLDYFNATENWLSRQFTIEYASLFRGILPLLGRFGLPLPLGGTSNHFRIKILRELRAWDPFNVTEDADLGMRLHRAGYRVQTLDSTTFEEACCHSMAWIKQRTRWLKGWMQTFGVHMRSPSATLKEAGFMSFLAFHAYFAGIIVSALAHPLFYIVITHDALSGTLFETRTFCDRLLLGLALSIFFGGYLANFLLGFLSLRGTRHRGLKAHLFFIPLYWLFVSAAAYRALWQLLRAPFYWEKTTHGISTRLDIPPTS